MDEREELLREVYAHCDAAERLGLIPPSARTRGLFFRNIEHVVEREGHIERYRRMFPERYTAVLWYPLSEHLVRLLAGGALIAGAAEVHAGMATIGRRNAVAFAESLLGRAMLRLLSRDPKKLLKQGVAGHRQGATHGSWTLEITGDRSATMHMTNEYSYIESYFVGAAKGTFEAIDLTVDVEVQLDDRFNGRHLLRW
jgi:uncharacterized protein (TIGR02265 family)